MGDLYNDIFVFGSNLKGIHGAGSAKRAREWYGAKNGVGIGRTGDAYAIPTLESPGGKKLPLFEIGQHIATFLSYAKEHPHLRFRVVKIGCGLAGFKEDDIKPFFMGAPKNVELPDGWIS